MNERLIFMTLFLTKKEGKSGSVEFFDTCVMSTTNYINGTCQNKMSGNLTTRQVVQCKTMVGIVGYLFVVMHTAN
jgi:hypothetical protein